MQSAIKCIVQTGIEIPHNEDFFPSNIEEIIKGSHIEHYASLLKSENPEKYEQVFSGYLKRNNINPQKISQMVTNTFKKIESNT